jgi:hypothetical protein
MVRYWIRNREKYPDWSRHISVHVIGLVLCVSILIVNVFVKFKQGGWLTLAVTATLIALCFVIRRHYNTVRTNLARLDDILAALPPQERTPPPPLDPNAPTAALLVGSYSGLGVHCLLTVQRLFPNQFRNFIFVSVGVIDSATFKGVEEVEEVTRQTRESLKQYVEAAHRIGLAADYRMTVGTEVVAEAEKLCREVAREFPRTVFFAGKLIFEREGWFDRLLHNETAYAIQRRLQFAGLAMVILPVRVLE